MSDPEFSRESTSDDALLHLLESVEAGKLGALEALATWHAALIRAAAQPLHVDLTRQHRIGLPEVIFAVGKSPAEVARGAQQILQANRNLLITRASPAHFQAVASQVDQPAVFHERSGAITVGKDQIKRVGRVAIVSAGTTDSAVAEEAAVTAEMMGGEVDYHLDVGVAGLHRLLARLDVIQSAHVVIVIAGFEGALASVLGGLIGSPIIAVPTSVGYGTAFGGTTALLAMLNSCAPGVTVVNIDNGFGAGFAAGRILAQRRQPS